MELSSEPRSVLEQAGATLLEMDRWERFFLLWGWWRPILEGRRTRWRTVNINRFQQARETGAETLAVGCPFCATMMIDANREMANQWKFVMLPNWLLKLWGDHLI